MFRHQHYKIDIQTPRLLFGWKLNRQAWSIITLKNHIWAEQNWQNWLFIEAEYHATNFLPRWMYSFKN